MKYVDKIIAKIKRFFIEEKCIADKWCKCVCIFVIRLSIWLNNMCYCCRCNMIRTSLNPEDCNAYIKWSKVVFYHLFPAPFWSQLFDAILLAKTFQGHQRRRIMLTYPCNVDSALFGKHCCTRRKNYKLLILYPGSVIRHSSPILKHIDRSTRKSSISKLLVFCSRLHFDLRKQFYSKTIYLQKLCVFFCVCVFFSPFFT